MMNYAYREYEKYVRSKYTISQFIDMWNDANIGYTIGQHKGLWYVTEDGITDYFDTDKEFFLCIDLNELREYEKENGWMY